jgi:hypothetical protein
LAQLIEDWCAHKSMGHIDGLSMADMLQRAATKAMKVCLDGEGDYEQVCFDMLDNAKRELTECIPAARERMQRWRVTGQWPEI